MGSRSSVGGEKVKGLIIYNRRTHGKIRKFIVHSAVIRMNRRRILSGRLCLYNQVSIYSSYFDYLESARKGIFISIYFKIFHLKLLYLRVDC